MNVVHTVAELRRVLDRQGGSGTIGLVPTMGALHAGHVALFDAARRASVSQSRSLHAASKVDGPCALKTAAPSRPP